MGRLIELFTSDPRVWIEICSKAAHIYLYRSVGIKICILFLINLPLNFQ